MRAKAKRFEESWSLKAKRFDSGSKGMAAIGGSMKNLLMGIDIGTSGCKIGVFSSEDGLMAQHTEEYPVYYPAQGWAEQDPEDWWKAVCDGIQAVSYTHLDVYKRQTRKQGM